MLQSLPKGNPDSLAGPSERHLVDPISHFDSLGNSLKDSRVRVCGMHERTNIRLSRADRSKLEAVVADRNSPQKHVWRAKIVLLTADGRGTAEIMQATARPRR